jgi:hypothetical protein
MGQNNFTLYSPVKPAFSRRVLILNPDYAIGNLFRATIAAKYAISLDFDSSP